MRSGKPLWDVTSLLGGSLQRSQDPGALASDHRDDLVNRWMAVA